MSVTIPVRIFEKTGYTRDVSASGILFELDADNDVGSKVSFELEFDTPNGKLRLRCSGDVVRKESKGQKTALAVKIAESQFE